MNGLAGWANARMGARTCLWEILYLLHLAERIG